jgi:hypothetical protein
LQFRLRANSNASAGSASPPQEPAAGGRLEWSPAGTQVNYIYAFDPTTVLDEGIRQLFVRREASAPHLPASYHFRPPIGLCSVQ